MMVWKMMVKMYLLSKMAMLGYFGYLSMLSFLGGSYRFGHFTLRTNKYTGFRTRTMG